MIATDNSWIIAGSGKSILRCVAPANVHPSQTYIIEKLGGHPGYQTHVRGWVGFLGLFLL
jgi:hypothetical protein